MFKLKDFLWALFYTTLVFWTPAFYLFNVNIGKVLLIDFFHLLLILFLAAFILILFFNLFFKNYLKSALFLIISYLGIYSFTAIYRQLYAKSRFDVISSKYYFILYLLIFFIILFRVVLLKNIKRSQFNFLQGGFLFLMIFYSVSSFKKHFELKSLVSNYSLKNKELRKSFIKQIESASPKLLEKDKRDIYYIVLDSHASQKDLKEFYGYDDAWFADALKKRGFYLPKDTFSNYSHTSLSIPSFLNFKYHDRSYNDANVEFSLAYEMLKNNNAAFVFNRFGYKEINASLVWDPTCYMNNEYIKKGFRVSSFIRSFFELFFGRRVFYLFNNFLLYKTNLKQFGLINKVIRIKGPKFVFSHFMPPHSPFIFNKDGSFRFKYGRECSAYINQLCFIDKKVLEFIDDVLINSKLKPIILIHADHGSHGFCFSKEQRSKFFKGDFRLLHYSIFSAFYLPGIDEKDLPDDISPVNNFRFIFNKYFGINFKILENKQIG